MTIDFTSGFSRSVFLIRHPRALPGTRPDTIDSPRPRTTSAYTSSGDPARVVRHQVDHCDTSASLDLYLFITSIPAKLCQVRALRLYHLISASLVVNMLGFAEGALEYTWFLLASSQIVCAHAHLMQTLVQGSLHISLIIMADPRRLTCGGVVGVDDKGIGRRHHALH